jgi:DNA-binding CsgD family transcriptional regulator
MDRAMVDLARARVALEDRDAAAALQDAEVAGALLADGFGIDHPGLLPWRDTAALAAAALGDRERAQRLARAGLDRARGAGVPRTLGLALRTSALVEDDRRLELLDEAVGVLEQSQSTLALAQVLVDQGRQLRQVGRRTAAQTPLRRGLQLADRMGAAPLAEAAREELRAAGARPRRAAYTGADALTPSERRVAELAADGLTNSEIAQALFVTPKTVQTHLTHSYRKLEISSRRELPAALGRPAS